MLRKPVHKMLFKKRQNVTLLIIPDAKKEAARFSVPWWFIYCIATLVIGTSLVSLYFTFNYFNLKAEIKHLEFVRQENRKQAAQILLLQSKTEAMKEKLESVEKLDREVRAMIGLKTADTQSQDLLRQQEARRETQTLSSREDSGLIERMEEELDEIQSEAELQSLKLAKLKKDVERKLDYLAALPDLWPAEGKITDEFGPRRSPFGRRQETHSGIDINGNYGDPVLAAGSGIVVYAGRKPVWGKIIVIDHGYGYKSYYAHNSELLAQAGEHVKKGQPIAKIGSTGRSTGSHLHFGVEKNGQFIDPLEVLSKK
ncbi:M23 family metallopeptidase [Zhaonella formicivorans]|uniref:M23 family metallopeptidase n=1 Tax=Zhaonella formicivorans TaxID=2528593 RepID=UPI002414049F|nr:M23 family metallopeptidase [Zhaonella formicivorans]